ncbi:MAG: deaminase [Bacteroidota bacterium]|nr:deaminase [Bacteroidota bacterium]
MICLFFIFVWMPKWYIKNTAALLSPEIATLLNQLGDSALQTSDIPVASVLAYDGRVIGQGYNTALRNNRVEEHAEINAISNGIRRMGLSSFHALDRKKLVLITTWEPCKMCEGAILETSISNVIVVKPKSTKHWFSQWKKKFIYQWNKQVTNSDSLQINLFRRHPLYDENKVNL